MRVHKAAEYFHNLIKSVKSYPQLADVRFVRRFGTYPAENPVVGYLASCGISEMKSAPVFLGADSPSDHAFCELVATIDLYCPFDAKPLETEKKALLVAEKILTADKESVVKSVELKDVTFNSDLRALVRKIQIKMEVYIAGEEEQ